MSQRGLDMWSHLIQRVSRRHQRCLTPPTEVSQKRCLAPSGTSRRDLMSSPSDGCFSEMSQRKVSDRCLSEMSQLDVSERDVSVRHLRERCLKELSQRAVSKSCLGERCLSEVSQHDLSARGHSPPRLGRDSDVTTRRTFAPARDMWHVTRDTCSSADLERVQTVGRSRLKKNQQKNWLKKKPTKKLTQKKQQQKTDSGQSCICKASPTQSACGSAVHTVYLTELGTWGIF